MSNIELKALIDEVTSLYQLRFDDQIKKIRNSSTSFLVCGSNNLGVKLAVRDSEKKVMVIDYLDKNQNIDNLIGITFSGNSVEVLAIYKIKNSILITSNKSLKDANHIASEKIPIRYHPMLAYNLARLYIDGQTFASSYYKMGGMDISTSNEQIILDLDKCLKLNITPIFSSGVDCNLNLIFSSQYMECLKRPAFSVVFPKFTHDMLWTLKPEDSGKYMFIHFQPNFELIDNRFSNSIERIDALGIRQSIFNTSKFPTNGAQCFFFDIEHVTRSCQEK
jgi:hypothetical protein